MACSRIARSRSVAGMAGGIENRSHRASKPRTRSIVARLALMAVLVVAPPAVMLLAAHAPPSSGGDYQPRMDALIAELQLSLDRMERLVAAPPDSSSERVDAMERVYFAWGQIHTGMLELHPPVAVSGWHARVLQAASIANDLRRSCREGVTGSFDRDALAVCVSGLPRVRSRLADAYLLLPGATPVPSMR